ncbi:MAG: hypothetical protein AAGA90_09505 [Actinomycetota bacterium]
MSRPLTLLAVLALFAAACGDGDIATDAGPSTTAQPDEPTTAQSDEPTTAQSDEPTTTSSTTTPSGTGVTPVALCDDVEVATPTVIGQGIGGGNIPDSVKAVVRAYTDQHPDVYAIRWTDRDHGGTFVVAFTDDPENHREALLDMRSESEGWTLRDSGYAVDVVQVDFSWNELQAGAEVIRSTLDASPDFELLGSGSGNQLNRVTLLLSRPTEATLIGLAELLPDYAAMMCVEGALWDESMAPPPQDEPLGLLDEIDDDPLVSCRGLPAFRASLLDDEPDVDPASDDPLIVALLEQSMSGVEVPADGWTTIERTDAVATFARFEEGPAGFFARTHSFENTVAGWTIAGEGAGRCELRIPAPTGVAYMDVGLDPEQPIDPESTRLHLVVSQQACAGGRSGVENMYPPEVVETETEIRIAIAVIPPEGPQECPDNPADPVEVELDAPIGDRTILDGLRVPATPLPTGLDF